MNLLIPVLLLLAPWLSDPADGDSSLSAALGAIRADAISADVHFIASDQMRGRDTPSKELRIAARYIRSRLQRLGFRPGGDDDDFFHRFELGIRKVDPERTRVTIRDGSGEAVLGYGEDYFFPSTGDVIDWTREGGIVFCGLGERSDYKAVGEVLAGSWALVADSKVGAMRRRNGARRAGALGILVTPGAAYEGEPYPERFRRALEATRRGSLVSSRSGPRKEPFPRIYLGPEAARPLLAGDPALGAELDATLRDERGSQGRVSLENVCGLWPGSDPRLSDEVILVSAHYDHVGARGDEIWNGADDNGSGTCGLLALADALAAHGPLRRSVMLIWVAGEEKGLLGSRAWAQRPSLAEGQRAVCDINIDMIGRNAPDKLGITPTEEHEKYNGLVALARELGTLEGFPALDSADQYYGRSDQIEFEKLDIPVCFLFSDVHEDYHQPTDTPDKIDNDKIRRVTRLVMRMLARLQQDALEL